MTVIDPDPFAEYRRLALEGGVNEEELEREIARMRREGEALDRGICPQCGTTITKRIDPRQVGDVPLPGTWVNYRCPCGYMVDRKEAVAGIAS
jgi:hypothetical protein